MKPYDVEAVVQEWRERRATAGDSVGEAGEAGKSEV